MPPQPLAEDLVAQLGESFRNMKTEAPTAYESDEKLIIALDFGTTFSGIAYCFANQRDTKVAAILDWPGAEGESAPKIPTLINYSNAKGGEFAWGASVNRMQDNIVGVKLLLDPSQERPLYLPTGNIKRTIKNLPKAPVEIAADFIGAVYRHAQSEIAKVVPKDYLKLCQKHFVLSVPAVWSDAAKNATLQASKIAGIFPVTLIKEPEAAALYTMHSLDFSLNVGDAFVVCDAGGGTVDLISYEVVGLSPNLQVKELVPGTGGMAGSLGLNQRFVEAVKNLVGEDQFADLRKTKGFLLAEKSFDREVKRAFKGDPNEEYFVNFPMASLDDDPDLGLEANCWRMTGKDLKAIFAPLITDILRLIDDQVKSVRIKRPEGGVTGIFLVGGFGSSQYLKACVEREHPGIQVLQPTDAWAAIVKGAALSKLPRQATVLATSATHHYGVEAWELYDPLIDSDVPSQIRRDGTKRAERMTWFINIGDDILRDQKIKFSFFRSIDEDYSPRDLIFKDTLFECADSHAPTHFSKGDKISSNCLLTADLRSVPSSEFVRKVDKNGNPYYNVNYDLVITLESALMKFSLEMDGVSMGSVEAKFS
jgi:molecular chaperone DnaK (HSP70)